MFCTKIRIKLYVRFRYGKTSEADLFERNFIGEVWYKSTEIEGRGHKFHMFI